MNTLAVANAPGLIALAGKLFLCALALWAVGFLAIAVMRGMR